MSDQQAAAAPTVPEWQHAVNQLLNNQSVINQNLLRLNTALLGLRASVDSLVSEDTKMAADLSAIQTAVSNEGTVAASVVTLLQQLSAQVAALAAAAADPAAIQSLADQINAQATSLAAAVTANTPAAPATP